jgi:DNA repair protein RecO (recombination protein O)
MQWSDRGIVLSVRRLGENSGVVHLLTPSHGLHAGVDKGAFGSRRRGVYQPGNIVAAHWQARLSEHLGMFSCELVEATAAYLLDNRRKLAALTSAALLAEKMLAEREPQPAVYEGLEALLHVLCTDGDWLAAYVRFEMLLLVCSGFGLDLACCAATGQSHDLIYVSPKSGRAVSRGAGEPYRERLFALPPFLISSPLSLPPGEADFVSEAKLSLRNPVREGATGLSPHPLPKGEGFLAPALVNIAQILDGLKLCGYFLGARVFAPRGLPVPAARGRLMGMLQEAARGIYQNAG